MSEFKFVQWGKGVPVDYQRLGAMMLNEQYLKDVIDDSPRGIVAWKSASGSSYPTPTGGWQDVTTLVNISFDVDADRLISFEFQSGRLYVPSAGFSPEVRFSLSIDGINTGDISGTAVPVGGFSAPVVFTWIPTPPLSKGSHSVTVQFVSNNITSNLQIGNSSRTSLIIRDEGKFISAS